MSADRTDAEPAADFRALELPEPLMRALRDVGYESPSPIQAATIPPLLAGRDMVGQAQTGTGKTAAFALPILARLDFASGFPQALVLTPTRELAIQVAEAFQKYAVHLPGFHVLPVYGGQAYGSQLHALKRGVHVIVGTPGRIIDHLDRGSLDLSRLKHLVLDEADEMLRMGFIDDVEKILQKTPAARQTALFSATMPPAIRRIAQTYLRDPAEITIAAKTRTADNIRQRFWLVSGLHKLDALTRILEAETFEGMIIFARTKQATEELAEKLAARGFAAAAINGDIAQPLREKAIARLKDGQLDILVATDVAARGLDVDRISHIINYDIPYDTESYVHRIGRTGRAGRSGEAILFVAPRERGMLRAIERATRQPITPMELPTVESVNDQRVARFKQRIRDAMALEDLGFYQQLIEQFERDQNVPAIEVAAALARLLQGDTPLLLRPDPPERKRYEERGAERGARPERAPRFEDAQRPARVPRDPGPARFERGAPRDEAGAERGPRTPRPRSSDDAATLETFRIEVGHSHKVKPGNIVGAIANEAGLESRHIGRIDIRDDHTFIDLPRGMPEDILQHLQGVWVSGQRLKIKRHEGEVPPAPKIKRGFPPERRFERSGPRPPGPRKPRPPREG
jgi:ATP-dependent RNA helicase DeaD